MWSINRFCKNCIYNNIRNNKGSFSLEVAIVLPMFIMITVIFSIAMRSIFIYEMMDNCFSNASNNTANSMIFASLSHRQGMAENIARINIVDHELIKQIEDIGSMWAKKADNRNGFEIIEESFDDDSGVGIYSLNYKIPLIWHKEIVCQHRRRIRSIWQYDINLLGDMGGESDTIDKQHQMVYTSEHGRRVKIYHTDPHCWALTRSYRKDGSVQAGKLSEVHHYVQCKICQQKDRDMER